MIPIVNLFNQKNLSGKYCLSPFIMIEVGLNGEVRLCGCADWMPTIVGNLFSNTLEEILSSPLAVSIRQSIINGSYQYCNERKCGIILNNQLNTADNLPPNVADMIKDANIWNMPYEIHLSGDLTCNLSCPSCRPFVIKLSEEQYSKHRELGQKLAANLFSRSSNTRINIMASTSGEIFASPLLLEFVNEIDLQRFPNVWLTVQTNGLLAPKRWHKLGALQHRVPKTTMTLDAARPVTYEQVRRGGLWTDAMAAMIFFQNQRKQNMKFHVRMVVQESNWREILEFYDLAKSFDADIVEYVRLTDWKSWSPEEFISHDVFGLNHKNRSAAQELMAEIKTKPDVFLAGDFD